MRPMTAAAAALGLVLLAGCTSQPGNLTGAVTVDGQPLKRGQITFTPADGKTSGVSAPVTDGRYSAVVPPGEVTVRVNGDKVVGKHQMYPGAPEVEKVEELVAKEFNDQTTLTVTVRGGAQEENFAVKARK
jgi:hypothetical protein